jgi:hypothetical protein
MRGGIARGGVTHDGDFLFGWSAFAQEERRATTKSNDSQNSDDGDEGRLLFWSGVRGNCDLGIVEWFRFGSVGVGHGGGHEGSRGGYLAGGDGLTGLHLEHFVEIERFGFADRFDGGFSTKRGGIVERFQFLIQAQTTGWSFGDCMGGIEIGGESVEVEAIDVIGWLIRLFGGSGFCGWRNGRFLRVRGGFFATKSKSHKKFLSTKAICKLCPFCGHFHNNEVLGLDQDGIFTRISGRTATKKDQIFPVRVTNLMFMTTGDGNGVAWTDFCFFGFDLHDATAGEDEIDFFGARVEVQRGALAGAQGGFGEALVDEGGIAGVEKFADLGAVGGNEGLGFFLVADGHGNIERKITTETQRHGDLLRLAAVSEISLPRLLLAVGPYSLTLRVLKSNGNLCVSVSLWLIL